MVAPLQVPNTRVTLVIDDGIQGWTESHFTIATYVLGDAALIGICQDLAVARCKCLDGVNAKLVDVRMSIDNVNHDSDHLDPSLIPVPQVTKGYFSIGGPDASNSAAWSYQTPQVSWPVVMKTSQPTTNPILYIGGMPASDGQVGPNPNDIIAGGGQPLVYLRSSITYLTTGSLWGALARLWQPTKYALMSIVPTLQVGATPTSLAMTFTAPPPAATMPPGSFVRMQGTVYVTAQKRLRLNGTYTVQSYDGTTLVVSCPRLLTLPVFRGLGWINVATAGIAGYRSGLFRNLTHKKRGRPLYVARGRS